MSRAHCTQNTLSVDPLMRQQHELVGSTQLTALARDIATSAFKIDSCTGGEMKVLHRTDALNSEAQHKTPQYSRVVGDSAT